MQTLGERIKYLIDIQGLNNTTFGEKYGIDAKSVSEITRDKRGIGVKLMEKLLEVHPELNLNWLYKGIGTPGIGEFAEMANLPKVNDANGIYAKIDPGMKMLLQYLDTPQVQEKIRQIMTK